MKFKVDNGPHIKSEDNTNKIMLRFLISLMPIVCFIIFKNVFIVYTYTSARLIDTLHPIFMIIVSIITSVLSEYLYTRFIMKEKIKFKDLNKSFSIIPGLLLALILPVNTPLWLVIFGSFS